MLTIPIIVVSVLIVLLLVTLLSGGGWASPLDFLLWGGGFALILSLFWVAAGFILTLSNLELDSIIKIPIQLFLSAFIGFVIIHLLKITKLKYPLKDYFDESIIFNVSAILITMKALTIFSTIWFGLNILVNKLDLFIGTGLLSIFSIILSIISINVYSGIIDSSEMRKNRSKS